MQTSSIEYFLASTDAKNEKDAEHLRERFLAFIAHEMATLIFSLRHIAFDGVYTIEKRLICLKLRGRFAVLDTVLRYTKFMNSDRLQRAIESFLLHNLRKYRPL